MKLNKFIFIILTGFSFISNAGGDLPFPLDQIELMSAPEVWVTTPEAPTEWQELRFLIYHLDMIKPAKSILRIQNKDRMTIDQVVVDEKNKKMTFDISWPGLNFFVSYDRLDSKVEIVLTNEGTIQLFRESLLIK